MAFRCGVAFAAGARFSVGLRFVSEDEDLKYRTADNGNVIAIKDGEVVGGAGASVGPDKIPSFEFFSASEEQKAKGSPRGSDSMSRPTSGTRWRHSGIRKECRTTASA